MTMQDKAVNVAAGEPVDVPECDKPVDSSASTISSVSFEFEGLSRLGSKSRLPDSELSDVDLDEESDIEPEREPERRPTIVVVDPWSSGNKLCKEINERNIDLIVVWEEGLVRSNDLKAEEFVVHRANQVDLTVSRLRELDSKYNIMAVVPGSETGVLLAEALANALNLPTNPVATAKARRNKYIMGETLRQKNIRAVKQMATMDLEQAKAFVMSEDFQRTFINNAFKVIVKPIMGAGSDDVYLCRTMKDFEEKFNVVNGKVNSLKQKNDGVLVQEYLSGDEYIVDTISKNGKHRILSLWKYDKREVNGRFNVYFGSYPLVNDSEVSNQLIAYAFQVLDALEFKNSPGHAEIKMTPTGPCLVEIGARLHGGGAAWLDIAQEAWGFDQLSAAVDAFSSGTLESVHSKEVFPTKFNNFGVLLDFVNYYEGTMESIPGDSFVRSLPSFRQVVYYNKPGDRLVKTVDCNTSPGQAVLIHPSKEQVEKDYEAIHAYLREGKLFHFRDDLII